MSTRVEVGITTYNRPRLLALLLGDLGRARGDVDLGVCVYDDASTVDCVVPRTIAEREGFSWLTAPSNHGLRRHWELFNRLLAAWRDAPADYYVYMGDDFRLCEDFFARAMDVWERIDDPSKIALNLLVDSVREHAPCWTGLCPTRQGHVWHTGWVDGAFLCQRRFLQELDFRVRPVSAERWRSNPNLSSGVGRQISVRLHRRGLKLFRVDRSLVVHVDVPSTMHPTEREQNPLRTVRFVDGDDVAVQLERWEP